MRDNWSVNEWVRNNWCHFKLAKCWWPGCGCENSREQEGKVGQGTGGCPIAASVAGDTGTWSWSDISTFLPLPKSENILRTWLGMWMFGHCLLIKPTLRAKWFYALHFSISELTDQFSRLSTKFHRKIIALGTQPESRAQKTQLPTWHWTPLDAAAWCLCMSSVTFWANPNG